MKNKIILLVALFTLSISSAFAHALWIETAAKGEKGQPQEVKIFFGEYESNAPDSAKKWFSNLKDFSLVLTAPNGMTKVLKASPEVLFYKTTFTPDQDGTYIVSIVHEVKDVYEHAKIEYYAFANVAVGESPKINTSFPNTALLTINPLKAGEQATHQVLFNKAPFAKQKVSIITPERKKQEPETDANGKFAFQQVQKGNYFLEAFAEEKTPGKLYGKDYEKVWHVVTYFTEVK